MRQDTGLTAIGAILATLEPMADGEHVGADQLVSGDHYLGDYLLCLTAVDRRWEAHHRR